MRILEKIRKSIEAARARLREELGTPQERRAAVERVKRTAMDALGDPPGGPEYDEDGNTIYPPGARILHDHANDERWRR